jgi:hypothetical protein
MIFMLLFFPNQCQFVFDYQIWIWKRGNSIKSRILENSLLILVNSHLLLSINWSSDIKLEFQYKKSWRNEKLSTLTVTCCWSMYELNLMNKSRTKLSFSHLRIQNVLIFLASRMSCSDLSKISAVHIVLSIEKLLKTCEQRE